MKYRDIAKQNLIDRMAAPITAEDGEKYNDEVEGKAFTPKQVRKLNEAREATIATLKKKWKIAD